MTKIQNQEKATDGRDHRYDSKDSHQHQSLKRGQTLKIHLQVCSCSTPVICQQGAVLKKHCQVDLMCAVTHENGQYVISGLVFFKTFQTQESVSEALKRERKIFPDINCPPPCLRQHSTLLLLAGVTSPVISLQHYCVFDFGVCRAFCCIGVRRVRGGGQVHERYFLPGSM